MNTLKLESNLTSDKGAFAAAPGYAPVESGTGLTFLGRPPLAPFAWAAAIFAALLALPPTLPPSRPNATAALLGIKEMLRPLGRSHDQVDGIWDCSQAQSFFYGDGWTAASCAFVSVPYGTGDVNLLVCERGIKTRLILIWCLHKSIIPYRFGLRKHYFQKSFILGKDVKTEGHNNQAQR